MRNQLGPALLRLSPQLAAPDLALAEVIAHVYIVLESVARDSLHRPFLQLMREPNTMTVCTHSWSLSFSSKKYIFLMELTVVVIACV